MQELHEIQRPQQTVERHDKLTKIKDPILQYIKKNKNEIRCQIIGTGWKLDKEKKKYSKVNLGSNSHMPRMCSPMLEQFIKETDNEQYLTAGLILFCVSSMDKGGCCWNRIFEYEYIKDNGQILKLNLSQSVCKAMDKKIKNINLNPMICYHVFNSILGENNLIIKVFINNNQNPSIQFGIDKRKFSMIQKDYAKSGYSHAKRISYNENIKIRSRNNQDPLELIIMEDPQVPMDAEHTETRKSIFGAGFIDIGADGFKQSVYIPTYLLQSAMFVFKCRKHMKISNIKITVNVSHKVNLINEEYILMQYNVPAITTSNAPISPPNNTQSMPMSFDRIPITTQYPPTYYDNHINYNSMPTFIPNIPNKNTTNTNNIQSMSTPFPMYTNTSIPTTHYPNPVHIVNTNNNNNINNTSNNNYDSMASFTSISPMTPDPFNNNNISPFDTSN
eukprot:539249_1